MKLEVRVPTLSDSVASGTLLPWRKQVGDTIARDDTLVDLETDKVILEIPAPASGTLIEIRQQEGAVVKADEVVAVIETGEGVATGRGTGTSVIASEVAFSHEAEGRGGKQSRAPAVTRPSGSPRPFGSRDDSVNQGMSESMPAMTKPPVERVQLPAASSLSPAAAPLPSPQPSPRTGEGANVMPKPTKREPMSRLRSRVAERLVAAQHTAAMLTTFNEVNMQPVNELRQRFKAEFEVKHGVKLGYMSFFVRAVCQAMQQFPVVNAAIDGSDIVWHGDVDIGIAISSPRGLVVPILRRAQTLSSAGIESAISDFARRARDAKLTLEDLSGGTFSITNGGVFGSLLSTPILNPPQSAILGMHTIQERPVAENGQVVIRPMMYLALTYDHRLIDGRDAVQFLVAVKAALEAPERLLEEI
ncbi:MAG: 2-oxoglutarate dehydrogenase complex dihydrolipoyllysine-residue succinyltransferase [Thiobacillus sp.]